MQTAVRNTHVRWWILVLMLYVACSFAACSRSREPSLIRVSVTYLPAQESEHLADLPPVRVLVLLPEDKRPPYALKQSVLPATQDNVAILGIFGTNSQEGTVVVDTSQLGGQRYLQAGISANPDTPRGIYVLSGLTSMLQQVLVEYFGKAGLVVEKSEMAVLDTTAQARDVPHYAVHCVIQEFSLISLVRHQEVRIPLLLGTHVNYLPIRGPTRAAVSLSVTFAQWPSGDVLWESRVSDWVDDPPLGEHEFVYASPQDVLNLALSRAVSYILVPQNLRDLLTNTPLSAPNRKLSEN
jgi:hypothetical protein